MALYEIKEDCRIANKNFSKGDIVSNEEVGGYFPTIMKPCDGKIAKEEIPSEEVSNEVVEESKEEEVVEKKSKKRQSKKK